MQADIKMKIKQKDLEPVYSGSFRIVSKDLKVNRLFAFDFQEELQYRVSGMKPEDWQQLIILRKGKKVFVKVEGVISEHNYPDLTPEQHIILGLFLQILDLGRKKLSADFGINTRTPSRVALSHAARSTIKTDVETGFNVSDQETQETIQRACA